MSQPTPPRDLSPGNGRRRGLSPAIPLLAGADPDGAPLHTRLYRRLREHILGGALAPGARLPSARTLAADLGVSRNTVEAAVAQLVAEGFVERRVGSGTVVAASLAEAAPFAAGGARTPAAAQAARAAVPALPVRGALIARLGHEELEADRASGCWATPTRAFPWRIWNRLSARHARQCATVMLAAQGPLGLPELRRQIAEYTSLARGLRCQAEQVLVLTSAQQALDLAARLLLDPGDSVLVEEPGYRSGWAALLAAGARLQGLPVDEQGLRTDALPSARQARLVYVTPSHQFPLGVNMNLARRLALLRWAAEQDAWVIEDDYDSEFRYEGRPVAALRALDQAGRVLYVGTYNKVLFPGLRLAYLILPPDLVEAFAAARRIGDGGSSPLTQAVLADFMASGHFAAYLRQARQHYARRRDLLVASVRQHWGSAARLGPACTGLHLVAHLPAGADDRAIAQAAGRLGLNAAALSRYFLGPPSGPGLLLSYGGAAPAAIEAGIARLGPQIRALGEAAPRPQESPTC